jgi:DNA polymerase-3 subunit beta
MSEYNSNVVILHRWHITAVNKICGGNPMNVIINQYDLESAIEKAEKVMRKSVPLPILDSILLNAQNDKITITANNLESAIIIPVDGYITQPGSILIDKSNFKLIKKLTGELHITDNAGTVEITANRKLKFTTADPTCYPEVKTDINNTAFTITEAEFKNSLKIKLFASTEEFRPVLCTLAIVNNSITAANNYAIGSINLNINNQYKNNLLIHSKSIAELDKILDKKSSQTLQFEYDDTAHYLRITAAEFIYITRLVEGEYLDINRYIPAEYNTTMQIDKNSLKESVSFASDVTGKADKLPVIFNVSDQFELSANADNKSMLETITAGIKGDPIKIGYSPALLMDILKTIDSDNLVFSFTTCHGITIIKPENNETEWYLIMPIRLKEESAA